MLITPDRDVYVLRTCTADMKSSQGRRHFAWPESGIVTAPDWKPTADCGHGLHGFLWGEGDGSLAEWNGDEKWVVVKVVGPYIDLGGKVKFESGEVVFVGDRLEATAEIVRLGALGAVVGGIISVSDKGVAATGYRGTATAGEGGTATAGEGGTATAGEGGTATAGYRGTATAGEGGTATAGNYGTATAGNYGTATAGEGGTATAGYRGTATAGEGGTATAGNYGTATAGNYGTATAGEGGTLLIRLWDSGKQRYRWVQGEVGEKKILADVPYKLDDSGKLIRVDRS